MDRSKVFQLRVSEAELAAMKDRAKAAGMTVADYVRGMALLPDHIEAARQAAIAKQADTVVTDVVAVAVPLAPSKPARKPKSKPNYFRHKGGIVCDRCKRVGVVKDCSRCAELRNPGKAEKDAAKQAAKEAESAQG